MQAEAREVGRPAVFVLTQGEGEGVSLRLQDSFVLERPGRLDHRRRVALGEVDRLLGEGDRTIDDEDLVFLGARHVAEGGMDLLGRVDAQQIYADHAHADPVGIEQPLDVPHHALLHLVALRRVDGVDGHGGEDSAEGGHRHAAHHRVGVGDVVVERHGVLHLVLGGEGHVDEVLVAGQQKRLVGDLRLLEPEQIRPRGTRREARAGPRLGLSAGGRLGGTTEAHLDAPDMIRADEHVLLDGPGQSRVQPGPEVTIDDPAKPRADPDLAGVNGEEAAAEIQNDDGDRQRGPDPRSGQAHAHPRREPVAHADPFLGHRGTPEASREQGQQHHRRGDLYRLGHEARRLSEGRHGVDLPRPIDPVEHVAGGQGHDGDRREIDRHHPEPKEFQQHDDGADVRGRAREQEHQRGARAQALENEGGRDGGGGRGAGVDGDPDDEHRQHGEEAAAEVTLDHRRGKQHRHQRSEDHAEHEPVRGLVEQIAEAIREDLPHGGARAGEAGRAVALERPMRLRSGSRRLRNLRRAGAVGGLRGHGQALDAQEVRGDAGRHAGHERRDGPEHGHDRVHERVAQRDRVDPDLRCGDEEGDRGAGSRALTREAERGGQNAAGAERQRRANGRRPQDRADLAAAEEPLQQRRGHEDGEDPGEDEPEQQEEGGLHQDRPGLGGHLEQELRHARHRRQEGPEAGHPAGLRCCE